MTEDYNLEMLDYTLVMLDYIQEMMDYMQGIVESNQETKGYNPEKLMERMLIPHMGRIVHRILVMHVHLDSSSSSVTSSCHV